MTTQPPIPIDYPRSHGEAVRAGSAAKARAGIPTGAVPLSYRKVRRNGTVLIEIDEEVAPLVREAFRLAALRRQPLRKIAETLIMNGLKSQRGIPLSATALRRILTNPFYWGIIKYGDELILGSHAPLVGRNEFEKVQSSLTERKKH